MKKLHFFKHRKYSELREACRMLLEDNQMLMAKNKKLDDERSNLLKRCQIIEAALETNETIIKEMMWVPADERTPDIDRYGCSEYILISFENFNIPVIGRYEEDEEGNGAFYAGDEDETLATQDMFVNAWMKLPDPYGKMWMIGDHK